MATNAVRNKQAATIITQVVSACIGKRFAPPPVPARVLIIQCVITVISAQDWIKISNIYIIVYLFSGR